MTRLAGLAALIATLLAMPAQADESRLGFPAFYRVVGVAADDVLNVRAQPGGGAAILDTLAHDASKVEVVGTSGDGRWALLNTENRSGYAAFRYLERMPGPPATKLPLPLGCFGTEPFWGLFVGADGTADYTDPQTIAAEQLSLTWSGPAAARVGLELGAKLSSATRQVHAVLLRENCTDGMSDFSFGLSIRAIMQTGSGPYMLEGCCSLR